MKLRRKVVIGSEPPDDSYIKTTLGRFVRNNCRKDIVAMDIDMIINDYKSDHIKIIEHKNSDEPVGVGQHLLLKRLSKLIPCYIVRSKKDHYEVYSYQLDDIRIFNENQFIEFLNNEYENKDR